MGLFVGDVVRHAARVTPHKLAATLGDVELTFAELEAATNRVARSLVAVGVGHGDRVAWWGETSLEAMPLFAACAKLGAPFMPVNARLGADEATEVVGYAKPAVTIVDEPHAALDPSFDFVEQAAVFHRAQSLDHGDVVEPGLDERDTHVIFFTSGSTGRSKGVVLSHRVSYLRSYPNLLNDHLGGTVCMFPLFHMSGWSMTLNAWQMRCPLHLVTTADAPAIFGTAERRRASRLYCIPAVWNRLLEHDRSGYDLSTVREADTGTSATPPELLAAIKDAFPNTVTRVYYGSTEAGPASLLADADLARKPGSVGLPPPGVSVRLSPDGEVCVHSELLMDGYFEHPEATADALRPLDPGGPDWYFTGDLGALDNDGYLSIVGRARDVLRTGGETVAPTEVESVLADHPAVAEVAVVGVPDVQWGEVICAVVVARPGREADVDVDALRAHFEGRLAGFKHPRRVELVSELPRTAATGQIQRTLLVERITAGS
jgi:acyl-CoA synthetase (AMP-forming)/AMP-acid ligase II